MDEAQAGPGSESGHGRDAAMDAGHIGSGGHTHAPVKPELEGDLRVSERDNRSQGGLAIDAAETVKHEHAEPGHHCSEQQQLHASARSRSHGRSASPSPAKRRRDGEDSRKLSREQAHKQGQQGQGRNHGQERGSNHPPSPAGCGAGGGGSLPGPPPPPSFEKQQQQEGQPQQHALPPPPPPVRIELPPQNAAIPLTRALLRKARPAAVSACASRALQRLAAYQLLARCVSSCQGLITGCTGGLNPNPNAGLEASGAAGNGSNNSHSHSGGGAGGSSENVGDGGGTSMSMSTTEVLSFLKEAASALNDLSELVCAVVPGSLPGSVSPGAGLSSDPVSQYMMLHGDLTGEGVNPHGLPDPPMLDAVVLQLIGARPLFVSLSGALHAVPVQMAAVRSAAGAAAAAAAATAATEQQRSVAAAATRQGQLVLQQLCAAHSILLAALKSLCTALLSSPAGLALIFAQRTEVAQLVR